MKVTNNLNLDLKEEIDKLQNEVGKLILFKDDHDMLMKEERIKMEKAI